MRGRWQEISALAVAAGLHVVVLGALRLTLGESTNELRVHPRK